jgi:rhodanese-related sulfurtransferase
MLDARAAALPRTSLDRLASDSILIDARIPGDFARGAIPDAINIWPFASQETLARQTDRLDRSKTVVIYCQTPGCDYADTLGSYLVKNGFTRVSVLSEAYIGYEQRLTQQRRQSTTPSTAPSTMPTPGGL